MLLLVLLACKNDCVDLCQQYELHLDDCGYGWSTRFEDEGWTSIEDCYDTYWEADDREQGWCATEQEKVATAECY